MVNGEKISIREYARRLNISDGAVRKAIDLNKIVKGYDKKTKKINPVVADSEWGYLHKVVKSRPGQSSEVLSRKLDKTKPSKEKEKEKEPDDDVPVDDIDEDNILENLKIHSNLKHNEAIRRREIIGLVMDKKKLEELSGSLVKKELIEKTLFALGVELKKALLNVPARITSEIRSASNDVEAQTILTVEITNVLNEFAGLQELKIQS